MMKDYISLELREAFDFYMNAISELKYFEYTIHDNAYNNTYFKEMSYLLEDIVNLCFMNSENMYDINVQSTYPDVYDIYRYNRSIMREPSLASSFDREMNSYISGTFPKVQYISEESRLNTRKGVPNFIIYTFREITEHFKVASDAFARIIDNKDFEHAFSKDIEDMIIRTQNTCCTASSMLNHIRRMIEILAVRDISDFRMTLQPPCEHEQTNMGAVSEQSVTPSDESVTLSSQHDESPENISDADADSAQSSDDESVHVFKTDDFRKHLLYTKRIPSGDMYKDTDRPASEVLSAVVTSPTGFCVTVILSSYVEDENGVCMRGARVRKK